MRCPFLSRTSRWIGSALALTLAAAPARDRLHFVTISRGYDDLLREEMKRMAGTPVLPRSGKLLTGITGFPRNAGYQGTIRLDRDFPLEWSVQRSGTPGRTAGDFGFTLGVMRAGDGPGLRFDVDALESGTEHDFYRMTAESVPLPLGRNTWHPVAAWGSEYNQGMSLWCYREATAVAASTATGIHLLDVQVGFLPEPVVAAMNTFTPEHTRLARGAMAPWQTLSVSCQVDRPFSISSAAGERAMRGRSDDRGLCRLTGTLTQNYETSFNLKCQWQPPGGKKQPQVRFDVPLQPGRWHLQPVEGGPRLRATGPKGEVRVANVAAFRITAAEP
ncbi:hypothetical protein [Luteolibacter marinus]|uniref:hypothetical protein n=1 Tax=Luteolibacter marinus TaxID=2776705 RepID=UPI001866C230|nr:hypothetical protein [Luteolibacter marinus]